MLFRSSGVGDGSAVGRGIGVGEGAAVGVSGSDVGSAAGGGGAPPHAASSKVRAVDRTMVAKKRMGCIIIENREPRTKN